MCDLGACYSRTVHRQAMLFVLGSLLAGCGDADGPQSEMAYTSDHGEELLDHRNLGHGHELWQELCACRWSSPDRGFPPASA